MWILGTAIWAAVILCIVRILRQPEPETYGDEPLVRELEILKADYPGRFCSVEIFRSNFSSGNQKLEWSAYVQRKARPGLIGKGETFHEAMADLKRKERE